MPSTVFNGRPPFRQALVPHRHAPEPQMAGAIANQANKLSAALPSLIQTISWSRTAATLVAISQVP